MNDDPKHIAAWLSRIISPGSVVELRILFDGRSPIIRHYRADQLDDLAADALHHGDDARGCYVTLNPLPEEFRGRAAKDVDIVRRRWLLVDCDPVRPADVSASDAEKLAATEKAFALATFLQELGWPVPVIADSGNGSHLLYPIDLPTDDGGVVARVLKSLSGMFSDAAVSIDTKVANASRIVKLYGTVSRKGPDTPERPHRISAVTSIPDELKPVPVDLLEALARSGKSPATPASSGVPLAWTEAEAAPLPDDRLDRASKYLAKMPPAISGECGSNKLLRACSILVNDYGLPDEEAFGLLMTEYNPRCVPPWDEDDIRRKIGESRKNVPARASKVERSKSLTALPSLASGTTGQPPYVGFPTDALPDVLRQFVELGAVALCCDPSYLALPMLAVCGSALGNAVRLRLKPGWLAPPILWTAIVGESGSSKTPAFRAVLEPVRRRQHLMIRAGVDAEAEHAKELQFYKRNLAAWERERQSSNEPPIPPAAPVMERLMIEDATVEAVATILAASPRGLLLARDELAGWFGSFDRYSSGKGDSAHWLSMYNAETLVVDRKTGTPRTISVQNAALSICGGIQPGILRRCLAAEHRESGMAARFLLASPPRKPKTWTEEGIGPELSKQWADVVNWLYDSIPVAMNEDGEQVPHVLDLDPDAKRLFVQFYERHAVEQAGLSGDLAAVWSKLEEAVGRLALILHFARLASGDGRASQGLVDAVSVASAVRLVEWFKREAQRVYAMFHEDGGETAENDKLAKLVEWIRRKGGTVTARDVQQGLYAMRKPGAAKAALESLAEAGVGNWSDPDKRAFELVA